MVSHGGKVKAPGPSASIPEPAAHRGEIPNPRPRGGKPGPFPWAKHRELCIALPPVRDQGTGELRGGWVLVGEAKRRGDGPKERRRQIWNLKKRLVGLLDKRFPLERYQIAVTTAEGTDCDMELYMRYVGTLTPEEDELDRKRRREAYDAMMARRAELKAQRALESRRSGRSQG